MTGSGGDRRRRPQHPLPGGPSIPPPREGAGDGGAWGRGPPAATPSIPSPQRMTESGGEDRQR
jgi:hypothetical protein